MFITKGTESHVQISHVIKFRNDNIHTEQTEMGSMAMEVIHDKYSILQERACIQSRRIKDISKVSLHCC
jgi:hypothetical protein